jgi:hypothetical protein
LVAEFDELVLPPAAEPVVLLPPLLLLLLLLLLLPQAATTQAAKAAATHINSFLFIPSPSVPIGQRRRLVTNHLVYGAGILPADLVCSD